MKIAVTYDNGQIFQHFGHSAQFKLYEVSGGMILNTAVVDTNGSGHGALAGFLKQNGVDTLICGGVTFGYFAIGNVSRDNSPRMEMTSEMTMAKIGLSIKNLDITVLPPIWMYYPSYQNCFQYPSLSAGADPALPLWLSDTHRR